MSITAVPLRPVAKGSLTKLWVGVAAIVLAAGGLAWAGQRGVTNTGAGFLAANGREAGVITLPSGLQYKVLEEGKGASPTATDVVLVGYVGTLPDGKVFDQNEQAAMPVDGVVPGFSEGLQKMKRGGHYKLWIPPQLGYGDKVPKDGPIPANSVLAFDVHLLDFKSKAEIMQMQQEMQRMQQHGAPGAPMPAPLPGQ